MFTSLSLYIRLYSQLIEAIESQGKWICSAGANDKYLYLVCASDLRLLIDMEDADDMETSDGNVMGEPSNKKQCV